MNNSATKPPGIILCGITVMVILLPFLLISCFNHPMGDDYGSTALVRQLGYWNAQLKLYDTFPPRYLALALSCLTPLSFGNFWGYKIIPAAYIILLFFMMAGLLKTLSVYAPVSRGLRYVLAGALVAVYLAVIPGIAENIYWTSGLLVYQVGLVLFIGWIRALLNWYYNKKQGWQYFAVACLCLAGMIGCNEIISVICLVVLASLGIYFAATRQRPDILFVGMLLIAGACFAFIAQFNGLNYRYHLMHAEGDNRFLYAIGLSFLAAGYYITRCLQNPFFWAAIVATYHPFRVFAAAFFAGYRRLFYQKGYFFVLWPFILLLIFFPFIYINGKLPPWRVAGMAVFFFLLGLLYAATVVLNSSKLRNKIIQVGQLSRVYTVILVGLLLAAGFIFRNNVSVASREIISGQAYKYDRDLTQRYELIRQCDSTTCLVPRLEYRPLTLRYDTADFDPGISRYFNKKVVIIHGRQMPDNR